MLLQTTGLSPPNIELSLASIEDTEEIIEHLYNNFYLREPQEVCLNTFINESERVKEIETDDTSVLKENLTIVAKDRLENNKIVGVRLSKSVTLQSKKNEDVMKPKEIKMEQNNEKNLKKDLQINTTLKKRNEKNMFNNHVYNSVDTFSVLETDRIFDLVIASVDINHGRQKIFTEMLLCSLALAKQLGFTAARVITSSDYTSRVFQKYGFEALSTIVVTDYISPICGEKVFANINPLHKHAILYAKKLVD